MATLPDMKRSKPPSSCEAADDGETLYLLLRSTSSWKACAACGESKSHLVVALISLVLLNSSAPYCHRKAQYIQISMLMPYCFWSELVSLVAVSIMGAHVHYESSQVS